MMYISELCNYLYIYMYIYMYIYIYTSTHSSVYIYIMYYNDIIYLYLLCVYIYVHIDIYIHMHISTVIAVLFWNVGSYSQSNHDSTFNDMSGTCRVALGYGSWFHIKKEIWVDVAYDTWSMIRFGRLPYPVVGYASINRTTYNKLVDLCVIACLHTCSHIIMYES